MKMSHFNEYLMNMNNGNMGVSWMKAYFDEYDDDDNGNDEED